MLGSCVLLYRRLSLSFSLMKSRMASLIGDLGSLRLYSLVVDVRYLFQTTAADYTRAALV